MAGILQCQIVGWYLAMNLPQDCLGELGWWSKAIFRALVLDDSVEMKGTRSGLFGLLDDKKSILPSDTLYSYCPCWIVVPLELIPLSRVGDGLTGVTTHRCLLYQLTGPQIWLYKKRSLMVEASTWIQHPGQSSYVPSIWKICPKSRESD